MSVMRSHDREENKFAPFFGRGFQIPRPTKLTRPEAPIILVIVGFYVPEILMYRKGVDIRGAGRSHLQAQQN